MTFDTALETLEKCRYCLMCRHADPLSHVTFNETLTPHGIALTIYSEPKGLISWSEASLMKVFSELDLGVARAHCITDQPFSEAVARVREDLLARGLIPSALAALVAEARQQASLLGDAVFEPDHERSELLLFVSDETQYLWPQAIAAVQSLLKALGQPFGFLARGQSSGFMAASLGLIESARTQAKSILHQLELAKARQVLVLNPGDEYVFKQLYQERLDLPWPDSVEVKSLLSLLLAAYQAGKLSFQTSGELRSYAYIDPNQVLRVKDFDSARILAKAVLPGQALELFWRRERAHPVATPFLQLSQPELAEKLSRARLEDALGQGAELLLCEDAATLSQLARYAPEYGLELKGLYELLADQLS